MDDTLIKSECYICLEPCSDKSPCLCTLHVHPKCLIAYVETSGHTECTVCLGKYPIPKQSRSKTIQYGKHIIIYIVALGFFFVFGYINSIIQDHVYMPFSISNFLFAFACYFMIMMIMACYKRRTS